MGAESSSEAGARSGRGQMGSVANYEASKSAFIRSDGLCCRPECYVQQWRSPSGDESAYCSTVCANNHGCGFKDPTSRERDAIVAEFYGALNTAASPSDLNDLQKEWANTAASLNLSDELLSEIQGVYQERLSELLGVDGSNRSSQASSSRREPQDRRESRDRRDSGLGPVPGPRSQPGSAPMSEQLYPLARPSGEERGQRHEVVHVHVHVGPDGQAFPPIGSAPDAYADSLSSRRGGPASSSSSASSYGGGAGPAVGRTRERRSSTEQVAVKVMRGNNGFGIVLGMTEDGRIVVTEVKDRSAATGQLQEGDHIVKVSGRPTEGRTHAAVVDQLKKAKTVIFQVIRQRHVTSRTDSGSSLPRSSAGIVETRLHAMKKQRALSASTHESAEMEPPPHVMSKAEKKAEKKAAKKREKEARGSLAAESEDEELDARRPDEEVGVMYTNPLAPKKATQLVTRHKDAIAVAREKMLRKEITRKEYNQICIQMEKAARAAKA